MVNPVAWVAGKVAVRRLKLKQIEREVRVTKSLFKSKTFWSVIFLALTPILLNHGIDLKRLDVEGDWLPIVDMAVALVGAVGACYGRLKARGPAHLVTPQPLVTMKVTTTSSDVVKVAASDVQEVVADAKAAKTAASDTVKGGW